MRKVAIVGTGQTKHTGRRDDVNIAGMAGEAVRAALLDANLSPQDIDAVVVGSAPMFFEGINFVENFIAGALGGVSKPVIRIHTGGSVGASSSIGGYYYVASGMFDVVLALSFEKLSEGNPQFTLSAVYPPFWGRDFAAGAPGLAALQARIYMDKYGAKEEDFAKISSIIRTNALGNKYAHLRKEITPQMVLSSPYVCSPLHLHDCCPTSDGAGAIIYACEEKAEEITSTPVWVLGASTVCEGAFYPGMDIIMPASLVEARKRAYKQAHIFNPSKEIDVVELYDAFSPQVLIFLEGLGFAPSGGAIELLRGDVIKRDGPLAVNLSGGVLSTNPIGASAMLRQIEVSLQLSGKAEGHQKKDARIGVSHAWGGWLQFAAVMVLCRDKEK